jgi:hypothetical protein
LYSPEKNKKPQTNQPRISAEGTHKKQNNNHPKVRLRVTHTPTQNPFVITAFVRGRKKILGVLAVGVNVASLV